MNFCYLLFIFAYVLISVPWWFNVLLKKHFHLDNVGDAGKLGNMGNAG